MEASNGVGGLGGTDRRAHSDDGGRTWLSDDSGCRWLEKKTQHPTAELYGDEHRLDEPTWR